MSTPSILAQQSASKSEQNNDSTAKPCIIVSGAVRSPARIEIRRPVRLEELLAIAGGVTERAGGTIQIVHSGSEHFQNEAEKQAKESANAKKIIVLNLTDLLLGDEKANPYLEAGDIVIVTELEPIYVTGGVVKPGEIYPKGPLTLTQSIKMAGGVRPDAKASRIVIYRQTKDSAGGISIEVNLEAIRNRRAEDPILQRYDIVDVGATGYHESPLKMLYPIFDSRPLIPPGYRVIY